MIKHSIRFPCSPGDMIGETMEIDVERFRLSHMLIPPRHRFTSSLVGESCDESRREYGYRLRAGVRSLCMELEQSLLSELRQMGHRV